MLGPFPRTAFGEEQGREGNQNRKGLRDSQRLHSPNAPLQLLSSGSSEQRAGPPLDLLWLPCFPEPEARGPGSEADHHSQGGLSMWESSCMSAEVS